MNLRRKWYFHVSATVNKASILATGLKGELIFTFVPHQRYRRNLAGMNGNIAYLAQTIAQTQVFARSYSVFSINGAGVKGMVLPDMVADFTAPLHRIIVQKRIAPRFVKHLYDAQCQCVFRRVPQVVNMQKPKSN
jgi:hypothetical protein